MDYKILIKELHKYWELEKQLKGITFAELLDIYERDILHFGEKSKGLHMLSAVDYHYYLDALEELSQEVWIPIDVDEPEEDTDYVVTLKDAEGNLSVAIIERKEEKWVIDSNYIVTAWKRAPKPYKEKREE